MKNGSQTRTNKLSAPTACAHSTLLTRICSSEELLVSAKNRWPVPPPRAVGELAAQTLA